jgi:hypothetical protein
MTTPGGLSAPRAPKAPREPRERSIEGDAGGCPGERLRRPTCGRSLAGASWKPERENGRRTQPEGRGPSSGRGPLGWTAGAHLPPHPPNPTTAVFVISLITVGPPGAPCPAARMRQTLVPTGRVGIVSGKPTARWRRPSRRETERRVDEGASQPGCAAVERPRNAEKKVEPAAAPGSGEGRRIGFDKRAGLRQRCRTSAPNPPAPSRGKRFVMVSWDRRPWPGDA